MSDSPQLTAYLNACRAGLRAEARLGSPRLADCAGIGICSIEPAVGPASRPTCGTSYPAFLRLDPPSGRLLLHLEAAAIPPIVLHRYFAGGMLRATDACRLSPKIVEALDLPDEPLCIAPGRYPVLDDGTFLTLSFGLTREEALSPGLLRSAA